MKEQEDITKDGERGGESGQSSEKPDPSLDGLRVPTVEKLDVTSTPDNQPITVQQILNELGRGRGVAPGTIW